MDILSLLLQPNGMWENIIFFFESLVGQYGVALILVSVAIKIAMLPLDVLNRTYASQNAKKQAKLKPKVDQLKKAYANNPTLLNQKTNELYQKEGLNIFSTCAITLVSFILTPVVFITLLNGLTAVSKHKQGEEFKTLTQTYYERVVQVNEQNAYGYDFEGKPLSEIIEAYNQDVSEAHRAELAHEAEQAVLLKYDEIKPSFLWIKNLWKPDSLTESAISTYGQFEKAVGEVTIDDFVVTEAEYDKVMNVLQQEANGANGYYILAVLSAVTVLGSLLLPMYVQKMLSKKRGQEVAEAPGASANKALLFIMPPLMAFFALGWNAAFAIYIVTGSLFSLVANPLITLVSEKHFAKKDDAKTASKEPSYSRKK